MELRFSVLTAQKMERRHINTAQLSLEWTIEVLVEVLNITVVLANLEPELRELRTSASCFFQVAPEGH